MPFKSEKQRKYMFANEPEIAKKWTAKYSKGGVADMFRKKLSKGSERVYDESEQGILGTEQANMDFADQRLTKAEQKKAKAVNSAGIKNYFNESETLTVPKKWLSSPDHVIAELAYITPREQKILLDADLYGSLNGQPNRGPGGIMSLQGAGDGGGSQDKGTNDDGSNNPGGGSDNNRESYRTAQYNKPAPKPAPKSAPKPDRGPNEPDRPNAPPLDTSKYTTPEQDKNNRKAVEKGKQEVKAEKIDLVTKKNVTPPKKKDGFFGTGIGFWDVVLFAGTSGLINPTVTKVAKIASNLKTAKTAYNLLSDTTKKQKTIKDQIKEGAKNVLTKEAKKAVAKKLGISLEMVEKSLSTIDQALNTEVGKKLTDKFSEITKTESEINDSLFGTPDYQGDVSKKSTAPADNDGGNDDIIPVKQAIIPVEKIQPVEIDPELPYLSQLELIRNRQNRRRSFFNANKGGLAGLFKVKN